MVVYGLCYNSVLTGATKQCNIILECIENCNGNSVRKTTVDDCASNVTFNNIQPGYYEIKLTIFTKCEETIVVEPQYLNVTELSTESPTSDTDEPSTELLTTADVTESAENGISHECYFRNAIIIISVIFFAL